MSVTTNTLRPRTPLALAPLVARARVLAGVPAFRRAESRKASKRNDERVEAERQLRLKREWELAEAKRQREEETAQDNWLFWMMVVYMASMFRQNAQYQPDMSF